MSLDTGWLALAALAVFVAWLGHTVWRAGSRRRPPAPDRAAVERPGATAKPAAARATRSTVVPPTGRAAPAGADEALADSLRRAEAAQAAAEPAPRAPARAAPPAVAAPAPPLAPAATSSPAAKTSRPQPPRFERVLGVEAADEAAWQSGTPLALQPGQAQAVASLCAPALDAAWSGPAAAGRTVLSLDFAPGSLARIARGDSVVLKALAADNDASTVRALAWLDSHAASALAATLLAALAAARHLDALGDDLQALRKDVAVPPTPDADAVEGRLPTLVQELWRLQRELRGNHAAAVAKASVRQQVEQAVDGATSLWRDLHGRLDAARTALSAAADVPALAVDDLQRVSACLQARADLHRSQGVASQALAAAWRLRTTLGVGAAPAGVHPLQSASAALRAGAGLDRALHQRLGVAVTRGPAEDEDAAMLRVRAAVAAQLTALAEDASSGEAVDRLAAAYAAWAEGFPDASGGDDRWLVRAAAGKGPIEVRRAAPSWLH